MKNFIVNIFKRVFKSQLIAGGSVLFLGSVVVNFANYLFHLLMGRLLGPVDYGVLESLISLLYLLGIPMMALSLIIVKYVSQYKGEKRYGAISKFFQRLNWFFLKYGLIGLSVFLLTTPVINSFLHLTSTLPLFFIGVIAFIVLFSGINRAFLQGTFKFNSLALSNILETILKLVTSLALVILGFKVNGVIASFLITVVFGYFLSRWLLQSQVKKIDFSEKLGRKGIIYYSLPVIFWTFAFTSLYTTDIVLARHFLTPSEAGYYAALAVLGKIIFFTVSPIVAVMFPLISERQAYGKQYRGLFIQSLFLVGFCCLCLSLIYFLLPLPVIGMLYGQKFLPAGPYLKLFAIFLSFYSLSYLISSFFLSIKIVKIVYLPVIAAIGQIVLISIFHQGLSQLILVSIALTGLLLLSLMIYYLRYGR